MANRPSNRQPQRRPVPKIRTTPVGRAGTKPMRTAPVHRNHVKRGQR